MVCAVLLKQRNNFQLSCKPHCTKCPGYESSPHPAQSLPPSRVKFVEFRFLHNHNGLCGLKQVYKHQLLSLGQSG